MENTKHTPGPWHYDNNKGCKDIVSGDERLAVCFTTGHKNDKTDLANAKLISQAPELLKALALYEKTFQQLFTVPLGKKNEESLKIWFAICTKDAKKAIKKATE